MAEYEVKNKIELVKSKETSMELSKSFISKLRRKLPELCSVRDLLRIGIYRSEQAAYAARRSGKCPKNFYFPSRGYVYPRDEVIEFLQKAAKTNSKQQSRIEDAIITHSKVPPLTQKPKDMRT